MSSFLFHSTLYLDYGVTSTSKRRFYSSLIVKVVLLITLYFPVLITCTKSIPGRDWLHSQPIDHFSPYILVELSLSAIWTGGAGDFHFPFLCKHIYVVKKPYK